MTGRFHRTTSSRLTFEDLAALHLRTRFVQLCIEEPEIVHALLRVEDICRSKLIDFDTALNELVTMHAVFSNEVSFFYEASRALSKTPVEDLERDRRLRLVGDEDPED